MKVIFLDIDGVLDIEHARLGRAEVLEAACVARLNRITAATGAVLVVTSTRRLVRTPVELALLLRQAGVEAALHDVTPSLTVWEPPYLPAPRRDEIQEWLEAHPEVTAFVILDDSHEFGWLEPRLIRIDGRCGLQDDDARAAIARLNADMPQAERG